MYNLCNLHRGCLMSALVLLEVTKNYEYCIGKRWRLTCAASNFHITFFKVNALLYLYVCAIIIMTPPTKALQPNPHADINTTRVMFSPHKRKQPPDALLASCLQPRHQHCQIILLRKYTKAHLIYFLFSSLIQCL